MYNVQRCPTPTHEIKGAGWHCISFTPWPGHMVQGVTWDAGCGTKGRGGNTLLITHGAEDAVGLHALTHGRCQAQEATIMYVVGVGDGRAHFLRMRRDMSRCCEVRAWDDDGGDGHRIRGGANDRAQVTHATLVGTARSRSQWHIIAAVHDRSVLPR